MWNLLPSSMDDETITNVFHTNELFKLTSDEPVNENPVVRAIVRNRRMVISVNNNLFLLENENTIECNNVCFEPQIDGMELSSSGSLVICALRDGSIHGFHIHGYQVFTISVDDKDLSKIKTFIGISQTPQDDYILMCSSGSLYRLSNIDEQKLSNANDTNGTNGDTSSMDKSQLMDVQIKKVNHSTDKIIDSFCIIPDAFDSVLTIVSVCKKFIRIHRGKSESKIKLPKWIQSVKGVYNLEHFLIGLTSSGEIFEICLLSNTINRIVDYLDYFIEDIAILQISDDEIELLLQTKLIESAITNFTVVEFPFKLQLCLWIAFLISMYTILAMKCRYNIPMTSHTHLVQQCKSSVNMYYLEEVVNKSNGVIEEIVMKLVGETQPSERLKKLIQRGHLDEAEIFAKQFKLSIQPILEARTKKLIIEMSSIPKTDSKLIQEKHTMLLELIKNITNKDFLLSLRSIEVTDKETIKKILFLLLENVGPKKYQLELGEINEQLLRLDTLRLIDPYETLFEWQFFVNHPNLFKIIKSILNENIDAACLIWKRHSSSFDSNINLDFAMKTDALEPLKAIRWYRHFVPCMIQTHPQVMEHLVNNAIEKIRSLQYSNNWPEIGLTFINDVFEIFTEVKFQFSDTKRKFDDCIAKLSSILIVLQDLSVLKSSYSLTLIYDDYVNNTIEDNAFNILLRVRLNHLKDVTRDFLYPIFFEKGLSPIDTIIRYITFLVKGHKNIGFWQERAVATIDLVYNEEKKLECALSVLRVAPVPWSAALSPLLQLGTSSHPLAAEIYNEYELQSLKIMKIKYGWQVDSVGSILKLAFRIVKMNLPEMIADLRYLVKVDSTQSFSINSYCIQTLLLQNRIEKCIEFLNHLSDSECQDVFDFIVNIEDSVLKMSECINEFYKYIEQRNNFKMNSLLDIAISSRKLRSKFQLELTSSDFNHTFSRRDQLHKGIGIIVNNLKKQDGNVIHTSYNDVAMLCNSLKFEPLDGVVELANTLNNIYFTCGIAKVVLALATVNEHNYNFFIDLAVLLIGQQINGFHSVLPSVSSTFSYLLAHKLLQQSLKYGIVVYHEINALLSWCLIGCDVYSLTEIESFLESDAVFDKNMLNDSLCESGNVSCNETFSVFESVNSPTPIVKPSNNNEEVLMCLSFAMNLMCITNMEHHAFNRINKFFNFYNESIEEITNLLMASLGELIKTRKHSVAFKIVQLILKYQKLENMIIINDSYLSMFNKKILKYALQQKNPNFLDLTAIFMSDSNPQDLSIYLENELNNSQHYINYLKLCETCNAIIPNFHLAIEANNIFKFQYYNELCKHDPSIKSKTNVNFQSFDNVLEALKNKVLSSSLLKRMSETFKWDYQEVIVTQILTILSNEELQYDINLDVFGKEEVIFQNSVESLCDLCETYINELTSTKNLSEQLCNFMKTINFYFYELFLCVINILDLIKAITPEMNWWRSILKFLKHKMTAKRSSPIGQIENDAWLAAHPLSGVLPEIAKYRLPFLLLASTQLEDILKDEVSVEDYDKWFPLIELLAQMAASGSPDEISAIKDKFCMLAVKTSISEYKNKFKQESVIYSLQPMNNAFLQSILRLISNMKDETNIVFLLYFVTNHAPEGADQVEAAYECHKFAMNNEALVLRNRRGGEILMKIKRQYPMYKTKYLLHSYGLFEDKLFQLVENPNELIWALYGHESILKQRKLDINKLAEEIAGLHGMTLKEIQLKILQKWFVGTSNIGALPDETFCGDLDASYGTDDDTINEEIVARAHYILSHWPSDQAIQFCITHIFDDKNPAKQLLSFECYMKFSNGDDDNEMLQSDQFIAVKCVYYLNQLGFKFTVPKFIEYDKMVILKKIWSSYATDPRALEVITFISMGYDIYIPSLWSCVLKQMVALNMVKQLNSIIELITRRKELRRIDDGLIVAWQYLITEPLKNANKMRSPEQEARLRKSLFLCQTCPVVSKIDLVDIARQFVYLERCHMAAVLLAFSNEQQKVQIVEMVKKNAPQSIKDEIVFLMDFGIYSFVIALVLSELEL